MIVKQVCFGVMCLSLIGACTAAIAQDSRPKIAIKTFANPTNFSRSTIGDGLTDMLTTELENTGKFNVLERAQIDDLTKEIDFGSSGYGNKQTFAQKGNLLGAQYLLMGKVTNFSYTESGQQRYKVNLIGPNTYVIDYTKQADVRVDFRLVDVATGETVISQSGIGHATNKSEVSEMATWRGILSSGAFNAESSSSLIGRATTDAINDIVRKLGSLSDVVQKRGAAAAVSASIDNLANAKGQVAAEEGGGLWILGGIGSGNGLRVGDHLRLIHDNVIKDKAGKEVYRKPLEIGSMEVTDVSQPDHAEARFVPGSSAPSVVPQPNDTVTVDVEYAKKLRGGGATPTSAAVGSGVAAVGVGGSSAEMDDVIKRADSYVHDQFWSQALDEYKNAAAVNPNDQRVLEGEALSHYMLGDFIEGDKLADKLVQSGGAFSFSIAHFHGMGICAGELKIQRGKLAYTSSKGDGFDVGSQGVVAVESRKISKGVMANEKIPDYPIMNIRWRDPGGHEKDYQMLPYLYSKQQQILAGHNFASAFPMGDSDVQQMQKFEESMVALINKYAK